MNLNDAAVALGLERSEVLIEPVRFTTGKCSRCKKRASYLIGLKRRAEKSVYVCRDFPNCDVVR